MLHLLSHFVSGRTGRAMSFCDECGAIRTEPCASL